MLHIKKMPFPTQIIKVKLSFHFCFPYTGITTRTSSNLASDTKSLLYHLVRQGNQEYHVMNMSTVAVDGMMSGDMIISLTMLSRSIA